MLWIVGVIIFFALVAVIIQRTLVPGRVSAGNLGWMSERWLAEHRASHSPEGPN